MLTLREVMIMNTILNDASVTIESLAEKFNLSKRTIRYDLENIEGTLFEQKVLPSYINVMKDLNESNRLTIKAFLKSLHLSSVNLSADERYLIVKYTLILLGKLNITKLSKELHVSRMTVKNDYDTVLKELRLLGLGTKLNYKDGFKLIGEEEIIRGLQLEILNDISKSHYYNELLYSDLKRKVFKDFDFEGIDACLYALQRKLGNIFSD
ncbi:MAG: DeoR family transcriptional regulator [Alkalibacterium sp.]|nr:DeoR family transcriptional regulator [Alkalibacterium sp.]